MNKRGFTLIEMVSAMSLVLLVVVVFWGVVGRGAMALGEISVRNELFEIAEVTESVLKRQLQGEVTLDSVYLPQGKLVKIEDFSGGEIQLLYFKEKIYNPVTKTYLQQYRAFNYKADTQKLLYQDKIQSPETEIPSTIGGYDCATHLSSLKLEREEGEAWKFLMDFQRNGVSYQREILLYPSGQSSKNKSTLSIN